jgi:chromosomal replication initiator protein
MGQTVLSLWKGEIERSAECLPASVILIGVADKHRMTVGELVSPRRSRKHVRARWEAMHLLAISPKPNGVMRSTPEIGRTMGDLDHTTVLHGLRRWAEIQATAPPGRA